MKTIVISNQKGGVGKSTISSHLAFRAVEKGLRTLFIDCDQSGNSSSTLATLHQSRHNAILLFKEDINVESLSLGNTFIFAGTDELEKINTTDLNKFIANMAKFDSYFDVCIIDTAPTLGALQVGPILAADFVVSPIELSVYSGQSTRKMLQTLKNLFSYNKKLKFLGLLPSRVKFTSALQMKQLEELSKNFAQFMVPNGLVIPDRQSIFEAIELKQPVWQSRKSSARDSAKFMLAFVDWLLAEATQGK